MEKSPNQKLRLAHGQKPKPESKLNETKTELPKLENYDLSKLKGGGSKNERGGWDHN